MNNGPVTVNSALAFLPLDDVAAFVVHGNRVRLIVDKDIQIAKETPGAIEIAIEQDGREKTTNLDFSSRNSDFSSASSLENLEKTDLLVIFTDGRGRRRIIGTPTYPASLAVNFDGTSVKGSVTCTSEWGPLYLDDTSVLE